MRIKKEWSGELSLLVFTLVVLAIGYGIYLVQKAYEWGLSRVLSN